MLSLWYWQQVVEIFSNFDWFHLHINSHTLLASIIKSNAPIVSKWVEEKYMLYSRTMSLSPLIALTNLSYQLTFPPSSIHPCFHNSKGLYGLGALWTVPPDIEQNVTLHVLGQGQFSLHTIMWCVPTFDVANKETLIYKPNVILNITMSNEVHSSILLF